MLNYGNLSDVEFEELSMDVLSAMLGIRLRRFAPGADGGIDLTEDAWERKVLVQVRQYTNATPAQLVASLRREAARLPERNPERYYVCCGKLLSPDRVAEIYQLFAPWMESSAQVITLAEIDAFLKQPEHLIILKKHYKLWIDSTGILEDMTRNDLFVDCQELLWRARQKVRLFVPTAAYHQALEQLERGRGLFITGDPGVGKTITSEMLALDYAARGYRVRCTTNASDLQALKRALSQDPGVKELLLVDDCFGQAYFHMREGQSRELLALMGYVAMSENKRIILNSRVTIYQEARQRDRELLRHMETGGCRIWMLDMSALGDLDKARILYNHLVFHRVPAEACRDIRLNRRYLDIIRHPNYSPRIIEFACEPHRCRHIPPEEFAEFLLRNLENPAEVWRDEYERKLRLPDRILLTVLYSLSELQVPREKLRSCFEARLAAEPQVDVTVDQFEASLARLAEGFVRVLEGRLVEVVNPSVNDYLYHRLRENPMERQRLVDTALDIRQAERLLPPKELDIWLGSVIEDRRIERYDFGDEWKELWITCYVLKLGLRDPWYTPYVQGMLQPAPHFQKLPPMMVWGRDVLLELLEAEWAVEYYGIIPLLRQLEDPAPLMRDMTLAECCQAIAAMSRYFTGADRPEFVERMQQLLRHRIRNEAAEIKAGDCDLDVLEMLRGLRDWFGAEAHRCRREMSRELESEIEAQVRWQMARAMKLLPEDITLSKDWLRQVEVTVYGAHMMVDWYLKEEREIEGDQDGDWDEQEEIDLLFQREIP